MISILVDVIAPLVLFYVLRGMGVDQWWSLLISGIPPILNALVSVVVRRKTDWIALCTLSVLALSIALSLLSNNPRTLLIRDGWIAAIGGLLGLWMVGSVIFGKPAILTFVRSYVRTKVGPEKAAEYEAKVDTDRQFRHGMRILTLVWGMGFFLDAIVHIALVYTLPIDIVPAVVNVQWFAVLGCLIVFHLWYTKKANLRA